MFVICNTINFLYFGHKENWVCYGWPTLYMCDARASVLCQTHTPSLCVFSFTFLLFSCWALFFTLQVKEPIQEWSLTLKAHILELKPLNVTHALSLSFFLRTLAYSHFLANKIASRTITQLFFTIISFLIDLKLPIYGRWVVEKRSNNVQSNDHKKKMNLQVCLNLKLLLWYS